MPVVLLELQFIVQAVAVEDGIVQTPAMVVLAVAVMALIRGQETPMAAPAS